MIQIKEIKAKDTYTIRKAVLRKNMTLSHEMPGDHDPDSLHLGVYDDEQLLCVGSFMMASRNDLGGKQCQLRGMATSETAQGKGYGKLLLEKAEGLLKNKGIDLIWCNARVAALDFYKRSGYQVMGDVFEVPQVGPHFVMFKSL